MLAAAPRQVVAPGLLAACYWSARPPGPASAAVTEDRRRTRQRAIRDRVQDITDDIPSRPELSACNL